MAMMKSLALTAAMIGMTGAMVALTGAPAHAGCGISSGSVRILSNDFPALHAVNAAAETCAGGGVTVTRNETADHTNIQVPALTANPAEYTTVVVANSSIVLLMNDGLIRPLNDLVAKHGGSLKKSQLITIDGNVMAVAFMANAQHLYYRKDILEKVSVAPPDDIRGRSGCRRGDQGCWNSRASVCDEHHGRLEPG